MSVINQNSELNLLGQEQLEALVRAAVRGAPGPVTMAQIQRLVEWAHQSLVDYALLTELLGGQLSVDVTVEDDLKFRIPS